MSEQGNIPIAEDLRDRYDAVCSVCSRVPPYAWERDLWEKELIERCSRAEAEVAELQAKRREVSALLTHWQRFCGKLSEILGCLSLDESVLKAVAQLKAKLEKRESLLDKFCASNDRLLAENERLKAPVSDEEWHPAISYEANDTGFASRENVDALLTARTGGSNGK